MSGEPPAAARDIWAVGQSPAITGLTGLWKKCFRGKDVSSEDYTCVQSSIDERLATDTAISFLSLVTRAFVG
jgi:hypothetical protein